MALTRIKTGGLTDNSITNAKMADDAIDSADIADGSIDNAHLAGSIAVSKTLLAAGTGLTLSTNTLNVDAAQSGITSVGTLTSLTVSGATTKLSNANAQLWVGEGDGASDIYMSKGDTGDEVRFSKSGAGNLDILTNGGVIHLNVDGSCGIGTGSPSENLTVLSTASSDHTRVHIEKTTNAGTAGVSMKSKDSGTWTMYVQDAGSGSLYFYDGSDNVLTLGTDNSATFAGDVNVSASGSPSFRVTDTTNTVTGKFQADNSVGKVGTHTNHSFQLFSNNTTALTLDTSQNATFAGNIQTTAIGIGKAVQSGYEFDMETSSGNANMRLKAAAANQGVRIDLDHHSGDKAEIHFYNSGNSSTAIVSNEITNGLVFKVGGDGSNPKTDAVKIASTGITTFSNNIVLGSNKGIDFSASPNASASSELFDDYEEGTWTPTIVHQNPTGLTLSYDWQVGIYTKIGNVVHCRFSIRVDISGSPIFDNISIGGFPFTQQNATNSEGSTIADQIQITGKAGYRLSSSTNGTTAGIVLSSITGNQAQNIGVGDNLQFHGGISYFAA